MNYKEMDKLALLGLREKSKDPDSIFNNWVILMNKQKV